MVKKESKNFFTISLFRQNIQYNIKSLMCLLLFLFGSIVSNKLCVSLNEYLVTDSSSKSKCASMIFILNDFFQQIIFLNYLDVLLFENR
jgi:biotin transporter BioY